MLLAMAKVVHEPVFIDLEDPAIMREMILHILEGGHIEGHDHQGRAIMTFSFPIEPWMIDRLATFNVADEDLEAEPLEDGDEDQDEVPTMAEVA